MCFKLKIKSVMKVFLVYLLILFTMFLGLANKCFGLNSLNLKENGILNIGTNATFRPFEYVDDEHQISGFDIDLIKIISKNLGLELKCHDMEFSALIPAIGDKIDLAIAAISKTQEREAVVNFSQPYFEVKQFVLTKKNCQINSQNDFQNLILATQIGTTATDLVDEIELQLNQKKSKTYNDYLSMVSDLLKGNVDVVVCDEHTALAYEKLYSNQLKTIDGKKFNWPTEFYCVAVAKNNDALLNAVNEQISRIKNSSVYDDLLNKLKFHSNLNLNETSNTLTAQFETAFLKNSRWKFYLDGFKTTMLITIGGAIIGLILGIALALIQLVRFKSFLQILKIFAKFYVDIIRGTPVILQLFILWFIVMQNSKNSIFVAIVTFGLNSSAYVCEIVRGATQAINKGQTEAGLAMGFSHLQTLYYIVLPQGLKNSIAALCNEFVSLLKETSVVGYIAIADLTRVADQIRATTYQAFMPLMITAAIYFMVTKTFSFLLGLLERRFMN